MNAPSVVEIVCLIALPLPNTQGHTQETIHMDTQCGKGVSVSGNIVKHNRTHTGDT